MSEICLDCWNKDMEKPDKAGKFIRSWKPELCESCGEYKRVIVRYRLWYIFADRFMEFVKNLRHLRKP